MYEEWSSLILCCPVRILEVQHSTLITSKKLSKLKNQQVFLDPYGKGGHGVNCCPPKLEKQVNVENYTLSVVGSRDRSGILAVLCRRSASGLSNS